MALKRTLTAAEYDGLADGLRDLYVADGDGYRLDVEPDATADTPPAADDDRLGRLETMVAGLVNRKPDKAKPASAELTARVADLETQLQTERATAAREKANAIVSREATRLGVLPGAVDDVLARAASAGFALQDDGGVTSDDGTTIAAYVGGLRKTSAHLFRQPTGSQQAGRTVGTAAKPTTYVENMDDHDFAANADAIAKGETVVGAVN